MDQLFAAALAGSVDAFGRIVERHRSYLKLLTRVKLRMGVAHTDASDIVQEVFVNAIRGFEAFRGTSESEFAAWLHTILARCIVDYLRKNSLGVNQRKTVELLAAELDQTSARWTANLVSPYHDPRIEAERRESLLLLANSLEKLPNDYREAIVLRQLEELSFSEVATQMDRTVDSVRKLWARGMVELRIIMKDLN